MMKLLVTGSTGLIGTECIKLLQKKYEIHAVYFHNKPDINVIGHCFNLLETEEIKKVMKEIKPDLLLHLAWETEHGKYVNSYTNIDWSKATFLLAKEFYENGGKRAVFAGTCFEYDLFSGILLEANTQFRPSSVYGLSKRYTYDLIKSFADTNHLSMAWGRIFYVYGGNENAKRLVPYVINSLLRNEVAVCGSGQQIRDYLYVEDVAKAFVLLLEDKYCGDINICSNATTKIRDIADEIANNIDKKELVLYDSSLDRANEPKVILGDNRRLLELGWVQQYNLQAGIKKTIEYYRGNKY